VALTHPSRFTCKSTYFEVELMGFEPLTSTVQRRADSFPKVSRACKTAGNHRISVLTHFPAFQEIYSGCCTVAAQTLRLLHPHKVRDDHYSASCLEATYMSFALG